MLAHYNYNNYHFDVMMMTVVVVLSVSGLGTHVSVLSKQDSREASFWSPQHCLGLSHPQDL